jgi:hypothetical protein
MPHLQPHPKAGTCFQINLPDTQATYDRSLQGKLIRLTDWADRIDREPTLTKKQIETVISFYAHRCLVDLEPGAKVPMSKIESDGAVYGTLLEKDGVNIVVLRESELVETDV